jgi:hypothetical protein
LRARPTDITIAFDTDNNPIITRRSHWWRVCHCQSLFATGAAFAVFAAMKRPDGSFDVSAINVGRVAASCRLLEHEQTWRGHAQNNAPDPKPTT